MQQLDLASLSVPGKRPDADQSLLISNQPTMPFIRNFVIYFTIPTNWEFRSPDRWSLDPGRPQVTRWPGKAFNSVLSTERLNSEEVS